MMQKEKIDYSVYMVTEPLGERSEGDWFERLEAVLGLGVVSCVQFREKEVSSAVFEGMLEGCVRVCEGYGVPVLVNDPRCLEGLVGMGVAGVHVGEVGLVQEVRGVLGEWFALGLSVRNFKEARGSVGVGVDYWGVGPVFETFTKADASAPIGLEGLREVVGLSDVPVVGIGGIDFSNKEGVMGCGAVGVAMVSGLYGQLSYERGEVSL